MQLSDFQALCFECYGTLIDKESGVYSALRPLLSKGKITLGRDEVLTYFAQCESAQVQASPELAYAAMLAGAHRRLAKVWGIVASDDDHLLFGQSAPYWPVFADAPAALQYLKRYFKLVILTNADRECLAGSKRQLVVRFDAVFTAQDIGPYIPEGKPEARNFDSLLSRLALLGVNKAQILHIDANRYDDHVLAATGGIASAYIDRRRPAAGAIAASRESQDATRALRFTSMLDMVRAHQEQLVA
jgi:2-haloalkanoic acid dehalogenase type II